MADTVFALEYPIQFGERTITELTLKRPKGKALRGIVLGPSMPLDTILGLASKMAGEPPAVFDEMDGADVLALAEVVGGFLERSPKTGESA